MPKIASIRKPILVVDGFAGPGKFGDGEAGSPLIICQSIRTAKKRSPRLAAITLCIEFNEDLFDQLRNTLAGFEFASARHGTFLNHIDEIEELAQIRSTFLYIDPYTVEGLNWNELDRVLKLVTRRRSVELLLNFNASSFVRRGLAALKLPCPELDPDLEDIEESEALSNSPPSVVALNDVLGQDAWQPLLDCGESFASKVEAVAALVCSGLGETFEHVGLHGVKARPHHTVPKYYLVFASRHIEGLILMNDEFVKSQRTLAEMARPVQPMLFETRPEELVPDKSAIPQLIQSCLTERQPRKTLIENVICKAFGKFLWKDIRGEIERMLKAGALRSATGRTKINDGVHVWLADDA